jgi:hypothetical protein
MQSVADALTSTPAFMTIWECPRPFWTTSFSAIKRNPTGNYCAIFPFATHKFLYFTLRPLDEPKKLKEKFDAIFDATKYNKASDNLSKLIKKKTESICSQISVELT